MTQSRKFMIREGRYAAEVAVRYEEGDTPWGRTMVTEDVFKTDRVRLALRGGDVAAAAKEAKVFELLPLAGE